MKAIFSFFVLVLLMTMVGCASASPTAVPPSPPPTAIPATAVAAQPTETLIPTETATAVVPTATLTPTEIATEMATETEMETATAVGEEEGQTALDPQAETERVVALLNLHYTENKIELTYTDEATGEVKPFDGIEILNWWSDSVKDGVIPFNVSTIDYQTGQPGPWRQEVVDKIRELEVRALLQQVPFDSEEAREAYLQEVLAGTATEIYTTTVFAYNPESGNVENITIPVDTKIKVIAVPIPRKGPIVDEMLPVPVSYSIWGVGGNANTSKALLYDSENQTLYYATTLSKDGINIYNDSGRGRFVQDLYAEVVIFSVNHQNLAEDRGYTFYDEVGVTETSMLNFLDITIGRGRETSIVHTSQMSFDETTLLPTIAWTRSAEHLQFADASGGVFVGSESEAGEVYLLQYDADHTIQTISQFPAGSHVARTENEITVVSPTGELLASFDTNGRLQLVAPDLIQTSYPLPEAP